MSVFACGRSRDFYVNESMRRSELVRLGVDRQREVLRQCSPEVKADLYRFKIKSDLKEDKGETAFLEYVSLRLSDLGWSEEKSFKYLETIMTAAEYERHGF